jgi:phage RecT family recombinase
MAAAAARPENTAVAEVRVHPIVALLDGEGARRVIEPLLPRGVDYRRVMQEVYLAGKENPEILSCTPESIVRAVAKAESWGLVIGDTVHLVPFNVKVSKKGEPDAWEKRLKAVQDYKGKIELIVSSGSARSVSAECVYVGDDFQMELGTAPFIRHRPETEQAKRGTMLGVYAVADLGQRHQPVIKWMPVADVEAIRAQHSKQWKSGVLQPWYARKSVVHQLAKMLPKNARLLKVLRAFEEEELEEFGLPDAEPVATIGAPSGTAARTLPDDRGASRGPRALMQGGYDEAPVPPAQHADDPGARAEDFQDDRDLVEADELGLDDQRPARRGRDAMREG